MTEFGFAKLRGFPPWPAQRKGAAPGKEKLWVRFYGGKNQLGTINVKNWMHNAIFTLKKLRTFKSFKGRSQQ